MELDHVYKTIRGTSIIEDLTFSVSAGEVFGFLGPNGAGKTTSIRMMVGLSSISSGHIYINGHSVQSSYKEAIKHVGAIIENPEMYNHLTAKQNLIHFARMNGNVDKQRIDELLELVNLDHVKNNRIRTYSLGMKQRLGIAQALIHRPRLLILDEPTNGLDPEGIRMVREYLRKLAKEEGLAVLVSSHLMAEMELMCDRFAIIQSGQFIEMIDQHAAPSSEQRLGYRFEVTPDQIIKVQQALRTFDTEANVKKDDPYIYASFHKQQLPEVIRYLNEQSFDLYEIREEKQTLEEKFLTLTSQKEMSP